MVHPGKTNEEVAELTTGGAKPAQPLDCPDAIYSTCLQCWAYKASNRPAFSELVAYIGNVERRLRSGANDDDLTCSKRFEEYQNRPSMRIADAADAVSRDWAGSTSSHRSGASQSELLKRTSSTMLFDGGYILMDSIAGATEQYIVLDPDNLDREAAAAIQDEDVGDFRSMVSPNAPVVIRSEYQDEPVYLPSDMPADAAMDIISSDPKSNFNRCRSKSIKSLVELNAYDET